MPGYRGRAKARQRLTPAQNLKIPPPFKAHVGLPRTAATQSPRHSSKMVKPLDVSTPSLRTATLTASPTSLLTILARRLPSICVITLGALAAAIIYLAVTPPTYVASTTLFIDPRPKKIVSEDATLVGVGTDLALLESQVAIIRSDTVLSRVVEKEHLDTDAEFAPVASQGLLSSLKLALGMPKPATLGDPKARALAALAQRVVVKRAQKTYVVEIEASSAFPVKAARLTQAIVDAYLADQSSAKTDEAQRANVMIDSRLGELREQVRRAETAVDAFKRANRITSSEGSTVGEQQLTRLNGELIAARTQEAEARARLDAVKVAAATRSPDAITDTSKTGLLQRLREQLAQVARREAALASLMLPAHPVLIDIKAQKKEIEAQITNELTRLAGAAKTDHQIALSRERALSSAVEAARQEIGRTNTAQIKQRELDQEVAASRELMRVFLARSKETDEAQRITAPDARMISPPSIPARASKPVPALIMGLALLGGLGLGIGRALVLDHTDHRVRTQAQLEARTGLTTLAVLPPIGPSTQTVNPDKTTAMTTGTAFATRADAIAFPSNTQALAYRRASMALLNRIRSPRQDQKTYTLLVATPTQSTAASTTAFSLAYTAASLGERVLLIDASSANPYLSDALTPDVALDRAIILDDERSLTSVLRIDTRSRLHVLPVALMDARQLSAAQADRLRTGLRAVSNSYEFVVIDGGAVLQDFSSTIFAPLARDVIIAAPIGANDASQISAASDVFDPATVMGVVLSPP